MPINIRKLIEDVVEGLVGFAYALLATFLILFIRPLTEPKTLSTTKPLPSSRIAARTALFASSLILITVNRSPVTGLELKSLENNWYHSLAVTTGVYILFDLFCATSGKLLLKSFFEKDTIVDRLRYAMAASIALLSLTATIPQLSSSDSTAASFAVLFLPMYPLVLTLWDTARQRVSRTGQIISSILFVLILIATPVLEFLAFDAVDYLDMRVAKILGEATFSFTGLLATNNSCLLYDDNTVVSVVIVRNHLDAFNMVLEDEFQLQLLGAQKASDPAEPSPSERDQRYYVLFLEANSDKLLTLKFKINPATLPWSIDNADTCKLTWKRDRRIGPNSSGFLSSEARLRKVNTEYRGPSR
jgi:hypothetical protein